jgi:DNA-binding GntR family transcriptional regulator
VTGTKPDGTTKDLIYGEVRRSIVVGHYKPGMRLDLEALSQKYGTSVTPVRDALQMLSQEGLVTIKPRSGYFVTHITLKQLRDLLELRAILEVAAIERAAKRITQEQLEELEQVHAGYTGRDDASVDRYTTENRLFHCHIAEASGNQELAQMLGHLHDRLAQYLVLVSADDRIQQGHDHLIEALRTGDPSVAGQVMVEELEAANRTVLERVIQEEGAHWRLGLDSH